jgi:hypothetical protein
MGSRSRSIDTSKHAETIPDFILENIPDMSLQTLKGAKWSFSLLNGGSFFLVYVTWCPMWSSLPNDYVRKVGDVYYVGRSGKIAQKSTAGYSELQEDYHSSQLNLYVSQLLHVAIKKYMTGRTCYTNGGKRKNILCAYLSSTPWSVISADS